MNLVWSCSIYPTAKAHSLDSILIQHKKPIALLNYQIYKYWNVKTLHIFADQLEYRKSDFPHWNNWNSDIIIVYLGDKSIIVITSINTWN